MTKAIKPISGLLVIIASVIALSGVIYKIGKIPDPTWAQTVVGATGITIFLGTLFIGFGIFKIGLEEIRSDRHGNYGSSR